MPDSLFLGYLSAGLGWIYFAAWSGSFYPQAILNYQRKSVAGFSPDFYTTNPIGHLSLAVFNTSLYFSSRVRRQYARRHDGSLPTVETSDVAFALHASFLAIFTYSQALYYPAPASQRLSKINRITLPIIGLGMVAFAVLVQNRWRGLEALDLIYGFSYIKLYITVSKYIPQAYMNYQRKSTAGWSIGNIVLDSLGATFSLVQLVLDAYRYDDLVGGVFGNPSKLGLSLFTIAFDVLFLLQHYIFYPHTSKDFPAAHSVRDVEASGPQDERTPLL